MYTGVCMRASVLSMSRADVYLNVLCLRVGRCVSMFLHLIITDCELALYLVNLVSIEEGPGVLYHA